jgi:hypothetical protein
MGTNPGIQTLFTKERKVNNSNRLSSKDLGKAEQILRFLKAVGKGSRKFENVQKLMYPHGSTMEYTITCTSYEADTELEITAIETWFTNVKTGTLTASGTQDMNVVKRNILISRIANIWYLHRAIKHSQNGQGSSDN